MRGVLPLLAALALLAAGCSGAGDSGERGHLNRDAAMQQAMSALSGAVNDPDSALYEHRIRFVSATPAADSWIVRADDATLGRTLCVDVRLDVLGVGTAPQTEVDLCATRARRAPAAPPRPAPSAPGPSRM